MITTLEEMLKVEKPRCMHFYKRINNEWFCLNCEKTIKEIYEKKL